MNNTNNRHNADSGNNNKDSKRNSYREPTLAMSLIPIGLLISSMICIVVAMGAFAVQTIGPWLLIATALIAATIAFGYSHCSASQIAKGLYTAAKQILPSIPILLLIGTVSATWMLSGVVPLLIDYGLSVLNANTFLLAACVVCAIISVLGGSSWTTIATIGVAFMGIGEVLGYSAGWVAGAVISGAYFGDKISPLSDTTVLASSSCGVNLFAHIRYMMLTTVPTMVITLIVFTLAGYFGNHSEIIAESELTKSLSETFNLTPWLLIVPCVTIVMIAFHSNSYVTLSASTLAGLAAMYIFQPQIVATLAGSDAMWDSIVAGANSMLFTTQIDTGSEMLNELVVTGGIEGMMPTVFLVSCAAIFGGVMIGGGMIARITHSLHRRLKSATSSVAATVASGITLNASTGDQFLSIIISANIYKSMYERNNLNKLLLSRTIEDSTSVTSVLIPWNSCGLTQATVLGVPTLAYLPYCVFNYLSPIMTLIMAWANIKIRRIKVG